MTESCKTSPLLREALKEFKIPDKYALAVEPWPYGGPDLDSDNIRYMQALLFARDTYNENPDSNHHAFPIPLVTI